MKFTFGSFFYFLYLSIFVVPVVLMSVFLRKKSDKVKKIIIYSLVAVNILQHLLKSFIYPQEFGKGFTLKNTAYNMCALLILATPFVYMSKNDVLKQFICGVGTCAGLGTIVMPLYFLGGPIFTFELIRSYLCHGLLFVTSVLPLTFGLVKFNWKDFWKIGFIFLLFETIIFLNDIAFISMGVDVNGMNYSNDVYQTVKAYNPFSIMGPGDNEFLANLVAVFTPKFLRIPGRYVPILWDAIPLLIGIELASFVVFIIFDRKNFVNDWKAKFGKKKDTNV